MTSAVLLAVEDGIAILTLNRPDRLNALDEAVTAELDAHLQAVAADATVRAVILTGAGRAFMAGGDIAMFDRMIRETPRDARPARLRALIEQANGVATRLQALPRPTIAAVEGACAGFGLSLMMACDLAVAADDAVFSLAYGGIGTSPDGGATWMLPRLVGHRRAMEIALLNDRFGAADAERWGLINRVTAPGGALALARDLAMRLAAGAGVAQGRTKRLLTSSWGTSLNAQLEAEADSFAACSATEDFEEGVAAFLARRPPRFAGR